VVHEVAMSTSGAGNRTIAQLHSTPEQAGEEFSRIRPQLAVFSHFSIFGTPEPTIDELLARTRKTYQGRLEVGEDLMAISVGDSVIVTRWPSEDRGRSSNIIEQQGQRFKDLNRNGVLDPYEDWRLSPSARAKDLVSRMTLEEKAGMMMHGTARSPGAAGAIGSGIGYDTAAIGKLIRDVRVNSFITRLSGDPRTLAAE